MPSPGTFNPGIIKILDRLKPTVRIFFMVLLAAISTVTSAQTGKYTIDLKNATVKTALEAVENQSEYSFLYSERIIDVNRVVSLSLKDAPIENIISKIFEGTDVTYAIKGRQIVLTTPEVISASASQATKTIHGKVTDAAGVPSQAISVVIKGTTRGVVTDAAGNYTFTNVPENATLVFSCIGMLTQEIPVTGRTTVNVSLLEDSEIIDEVVVIAYGTVKKRDLTGSVSSVKATDVNLAAASSIGHALKGKAAGLSISQNSAQPGGGLDILIRGAGSVNASNQPLYIVDGFPIATLDQPGSGNERLDAGTQSILNFVNPKDISSVEVLKDASATAIYGARAAHGVVLITNQTGDYRESSCYI